MIKIYERNTRSNNELRTLQLIELKILIEFVRICDKYNIKYFLSDGTLLGAIRHNGFIPWDDDIDVGLMRDEYKKFIDVCLNELKPEYFLQTFDTELNYDSSFSKIRMNNTEFKTEYNEGVICNNGIYIDIFPYDYVSDVKIFRDIHYILIKFWSKLYLFKCNCRCIPSYPHNRMYNRIYNVLIRFFSKFLPKSLVIYIRESLLRKYEGKPTHYCMNFPYYTYPTDIFNTFIMVEFEGFKFSAPKEYEQYLKITYGDYLTPPPEHKRVRHSPYKPIFGPYACITMNDILNDEGD